MKTLSLKTKPMPVTQPATIEPTAKIKKTPEELKAILKQEKKDAFFKRREQVRAMRKLLTETHPELFNMEAPKLLAINIHKELRKNYPQFSWQTLRAFLHKWCNHKLYTALDPNGPRFHLDGTEQSVDALSKRTREGVVETTSEDTEIIETEQKK